MQRRPWKANTKAMLVLQGLKKRPVIEQCPVPQLRHAQDDPWCDQLIANARRAFETQTRDPHLTHLQREHVQLRTVIGEFIVELKQTDEVWEYEARPLCENRERNEAMLAALHCVKADHPVWGYRRVWAPVRDIQQHAVTQSASIAE